MLVYNELSHYAPNSLKSDGGGSRNLTHPKWGGIAKSQAVFLGGIAKYTR